jgi:hypothetical protein
MATTSSTSAEATDSSPSTFEVQAIRLIGPSGALAWRCNQDLVRDVGKLFIECDAKERRTLVKCEQQDVLVHVGGEAGSRDAKSMLWTWREAEGPICQLPNAACEQSLRFTILQQYNAFQQQGWPADMNALARAGVIYFSCWNAGLTACDTDTEPMPLPKTFFLHVVEAILSEADCKQSSDRAAQVVCLSEFGAEWLREQHRAKPDANVRTHQTTLERKDARDRDRKSTLDQTAKELKAVSTGGDGDAMDTSAQSCSSMSSSSMSTKTGSKPSSSKQGGWKKACDGATVREVLADVAIEGRTLLEITHDVNEALRRVSKGQASAVEPGTVKKSVCRLQNYVCDRKTHCYMLKPQAEDAP